MSIHIKPENKGKFTSYCGGKVTAACIAKGKKSSSAAVRKRATFADNARKWNHEYGGQLSPYAYGGMLMDEYGFGGWLKEHAGGLLKGAGSLASFIPVVGQIAGPVLNVAGSMIQNKQAQNAQSDAQQAQMDAQAAAQAEIQRTQDRQIRFENIVDRNQINYGPSFMELGGQLGMGMMDPQITDYTKGNTHQGRTGGIPVDSRGNPATTSRSSVVGMTERGEVSWKGYIFSDKLKLD